MRAAALAIIVILSAMLFLSQRTALSGVISSGGGELIRDAHNPWFLSNTPEVSYCIMRDAQSFRYSESELDTFFQQALQYWRNELERSANGQFGNPHLLTQTFRKEACIDSIALRLQFGLLTDDQREELVIDPKDYVGFAIRTNYDTVNLRATGYIYISPDNGPNRYAGQQYVDNAWHHHQGVKLRDLLIHELGHILGFQHFGNSYMARDMPEQLVLPSTTPVSSMFRDTLSFNFNEPINVCLFDHELAFAASILGMPAGTRAYRLDFTVERNPETTLSAISFMAIDDPSLTYGRVHFHTPGSAVAFSNPQNATVRITDEQTLFPYPPANGIPSKTIYQAMSSRSFDTHFRHDATSHLLQVQLEPEFLTIAAYDEASRTMRSIGRADRRERNSGRCP